MVAFDSYYDLLDVDRDATPEEIQAAYREKAKIYHPDVSDHNNAEEIFKHLTDAKETLTSKQKRKKYDDNSHSEYTTESKDTTKQPSANRDTTDWESTDQNKNYNNNYGEQATNSQTQNQRATHNPNPDDWAGRPGWSYQADSQTDSTTWDDNHSETQSEPQNRKPDPSNVIPTNSLKPAILLSFLTYTFAMYGMFSPISTPIHSFVALVLFPFIFIGLVSTRLGFYVFSLALLTTPPLLLWKSTLNPASTQLLAATLFQFFGGILTLLVASINPN